MEITIEMLEQNLSALEAQRLQLVNQLGSVEGQIGYTRNLIAHLKKEEAEEDASPASPPDEG